MIDNKSHQLMSEGKYILASSQAYQESIMLKKLEHSLFTYYLLKGLEGAEGKSVDVNGNVTPITLGEYIYEQIITLPPEGRPVQKPIFKTENSGQVILASYPTLRSLWQPVSMQNWKFVTPTDFREICQIILADMGFKNIRHLSNPSESEDI